MTPAERKAAHDARKRDAGLVLLTIWTKPENRDILKALAKMDPNDLKHIVGIE